MISSITPIYKASLRQQPNQNGYSQHKNPKKLFKEILNKEMSKELGSKFSVRI